VNPSPLDLYIDARERESAAWHALRARRTETAYAKWRAAQFDLIEAGRRVDASNR
jgi:hypothetical protein